MAQFWMENSIQYSRQNGQISDSLWFSGLLPICQMRVAFWAICCRDMSFLSPPNKIDGTWATMHTCEHSPSVETSPSWRHTGTDKRDKTLQTGLNPISFATYIITHLLTTKVPRIIYLNNEWWRGFLYFTRRFGNPWHVMKPHRWYLCCSDLFLYLPWVTSIPQYYALLTRY